MELQSAYGSVVDKTVTIDGTQLKLSNGQTLPLIPGEWNTITLNLELTEGTASVTANEVTKTIPVDLDLSDYVCYITINSIHMLYLDALLVVFTLEAVALATDASSVEP